MAIHTSKRQGRGVGSCFLNLQPRVPPFPPSFKSCRRRPTTDGRRSPSGPPPHGSLDHLLTRSLRRQAHRTLDTKHQTLAAATAAYNSGWRSKRFGGIILSVLRKMQQRQGALHSPLDGLERGIAGVLYRNHICLRPLPCGCCKRLDWKDL